MRQYTANTIKVQGLAEPKLCDKISHGGQKEDFLCRQLRLNQRIE
jgi:hypothetical protein